MGNVTAEFVRRHSSLRWLVPLFKHLEDVIGEYVGWVEQPPYFNNEAASVSLLVAAGSRGGYVTLSDYRTEKRKNGKYKNGRCDLLIDKRRGRYLVIEAKQTYVGPRAGIKRLEYKLKEACSESKQLSGQKPNVRAGLVFAILSLSSDDASRFRFEDFRKKLKSAKCDLCWVWYDRDWKKYRWEEDRYYPGFAVLLHR